MARLPASLQIGTRFRHRFQGGCLSREFGLLLVLIDEMNEGLDQVVVDLPEAVRGKTQQIQPGRRGSHPL